MMLESNLIEGNQKLTTPDNLEYGVSITDECLGWEITQNLLELASASHKEALEVH